jgi:hypothetical protein
MDDIKKAYRSLVKVYHPDRDASLDAQAMYKEIRTAYDKLRNEPFHHRNDARHVHYHAKVKHSTRDFSNNFKKPRNSTADYRSFSEHTTWVHEDFTPEPHHRKDNVSFLISIFIRNFKGLSTIDILITVTALVFYYVISVYNGYPDSTVIVSLHIAVWIIFIFIRYFSYPSTWPLFKRILVAVIYGGYFCLLVGGRLYDGVASFIFALILMIDHSKDSGFKRQ